MTQAPNDSLPGPAALARSLGYAFVVGATVALVLTLIPNSADTNETGILSLVALAYAVGLLCLRAEDRLPSWATPAALALATVLVTYAVEFFADPIESVWAIFYVAVGLQAGYFLSRWWAAAQVALVAAAYGLVMRGHDGALELWLGTVATVALPRGWSATMRVRVRRLIDRLADAARTDAHTGLLNRRGLQEIAELELERARRGDRPVSIVVVDIDRFEDFNEQHGHTRFRPRAQGRRRPAPGEQAPDRRRGAHQRRGVRPDRARTPTSTAPTSSPTGCGARFARRSPGTA